MVDKAKIIEILNGNLPDEHSKYLRTMEVGQDIIGIKKIEGENRLLEY